MKTIRTHLFDNILAYNISGIKIMSYFYSWLRPCFYRLSAVTSPLLSLKDPTFLFIMEWIHNPRSKDVITYRSFISIFFIFFIFQYWRSVYQINFLYFFYICLLAFLNTLCFNYSLVLDSNAFNVQYRQKYVLILFIYIENILVVN